MNIRATVGIGTCLALLTAFTPGVSRADEPQRGGAAELLRLLETKGVLSQQEAADLGAAFVRDETAAQKQETMTPLVYDELRDAIVACGREGIVTEDDRAILLARLESLKQGTPLVFPQDDAVSSLGRGKLTVRVQVVADSDLHRRLGVMRERTLLSEAEAQRLYDRYQSAYRLVRKSPAEIELPPAPLVPEENGTVISQLMNEGVIGEQEKTELELRLDEVVRRSKNEQVTERKRQTVGIDEITYRRTLVSVETIRDSLQQLAHQRIVTPVEADELFVRFTKKYPTDQMADEVGSDARELIQLQMEQKADAIAAMGAAVAKVPEWVQRFKLSGDIRLRFQTDFLDNNNDRIYSPAKPSEYMNTRYDRLRFRVRGRLHMTAKVNDTVDAFLGLATGTTSDPVSTNQTLGDSLNKKTVTIDTLYLRWKPNTDVTAWGGRMANPWFSTDLVWDRDLNFDGFAASYTPMLTNQVNLFATIGAFPLQEIELTSRDKWLVGGQIGASYRPLDTLSAKLGIAYYRFENTQGRPSVTVANEFDYSAPGYLQKGNTYYDINSAISGAAFKSGLATRFQELNITTAIDIGLWDPFHVMLMGDYVVNLGYRSSDISRLAGIDGGSQNQGYQLGLAVGSGVMKEFADWRTYINYRHLEADAVLDAYTDSDFHLGGTNAKGWTIGGEVVVGNNITFGVKWMTASEVNSQNRSQFTAQYADSASKKLDIDVVQFDLNAKF